MPFRPSLDYSDKDFDALRKRVFALIHAAFPTWSDENVANFGNIIIDSFCFVGDTFTFYQDKQARETRWTQATQRKNLINIAKLIGFTPSGASASAVTARITIANGPLAGDTPIPAGTLVRTLEVTDPITYQILEATTIPAGQTSVTAVAENSESDSDAFSSTGLANQSFTLTATPYLDDSARITAANGSYIQVPNFLNSRSTDLHYRVVVDQNDRARVDFGNGVNGAIPTGTITVAYKTGGGAAGRVESGALQTIVGTFTDVFGNAANLTVTNDAASSPGQDRQTNSSMQQLAPESVRVSDRTIAREDYEIVARRLPTLVSRALMLTKNQDAAVPENAGLLLLVPPGAGALPGTTIDAVRAEFTLFPYGNTFNLSIQTAVYSIVNISARIYLTAGNATPERKAIVKAAVLAGLSGFFADQNPDQTPNMAVDFGFNQKDEDGNPAGAVAWSDVGNVIRDTTGVKKLDPGPIGLLLNSARADWALANREFPKLGSVTLVDADTGVQL